MEHGRIFVLDMYQKYEIIYRTKILKKSFNNTVTISKFSVMFQDTGWRIELFIDYNGSCRQFSIYLFVSPFNQWFAIVYTRADSLNTKHARSTFRFCLHSIINVTNDDDINYH